ncbi:MAG: flagellar export chaperone FliS [Lachnospirales bacterium]
MATKRNPYEAYSNNAILTASKEELTLMLFDGAVKFCNKAIIALEKKDIMETHKYIMKTEAIIEEFQITLDMQYDVSKDLFNMYDYIYRRLVEANMAKDKVILEECLGLIRELRDTWKEAMKLAKV